MADKQSTEETTKSVQTLAVPNPADRKSEKSASGSLHSGSADGLENQEKSEKPGDQPTAYSMRPAFGEMFPAHHQEHNEQRYGRETQRLVWKSINILRVA